MVAVGGTLGKRAVLPPQIYEAIRWPRTTEFSPRVHKQTTFLKQVTAPISRFGFVADNVGKGEAIIGNPTAEAVATFNRAHDNVGYGQCPQCLEEWPALCGQGRNA